jgi:hypothetical protein
MAPALIRAYLVRRPLKRTKNDLSQLIQSFDGAKTSAELDGNFGKLVKLGFFQSLKIVDRGKVFSDEEQYRWEDLNILRENYRYKWRYSDDERPRGCCYDCRIKYSEFPDVIISDELWEEINPTTYEGSGLLCPTCMANRLNYLGKWNSATMEAKLCKAR